eukprot:CCRYP_019950-RA/>CCRYP_019950-RA protein AED:0.45 eAED:0.45 QI:117/1/1/1/0/0/2/0/56
MGSSLTGLVPNSFYDFTIVYKRVTNHIYHIVRLMTVENFIVLLCTATKGGGNLIIV